MNIVKEVGFSRIHVFKYSKRKNTKAAEMKNQIDGNIKKERSEKLIALGEEYQEIFERENMKTPQSVLFEEEHDGVYYGYTTNYIRVKAKSNEDLTNKIKKVKILDTGEIANCEVIGD